jgi:hypothetical protein
VRSKSLVLSIRANFIERFNDQIKCQTKKKFILIFYFYFILFFFLFFCCWCRSFCLSGDVSSSSSVVVLSYPRYCRYRALLRRIEGKENEWMNKESVQLAINSLGIPTTTNQLNILFCRDTFEHEALLQNDLNCDHLGINFY